MHQNALGGRTLPGPPNPLAELKEGGIEGAGEGGKDPPPVSEVH